MTCRGLATRCVAIPCPSHVKTTRHGFILFDFHLKGLPLVALRKRGRHFGGSSRGAIERFRLRRYRAPINHRETQSYNAIAVKWKAFSAGNFLSSWQSNNKYI